MLSQYSHSEEFMVIDGVKKLPLKQPVFIVE